jgi:drug/metabolite transporter (DMT)-like permease
LQVAKFGAAITDYDAVPASSNQADGDDNLKTGPVLCANLLDDEDGLVSVPTITVETSGNQSITYNGVNALNGAIPFVLYAFAALHLPASYSVLINSTAPLFGAVFSSFWLAEKLTFRKVGAILVAGCGVGLVARVGPAQVDPLFLVSICACVGAAACYGLSAVYMKKYAGGTKPMGMTGGSMLMAGLMLLPILPFAPIRGEVTPLVIANLLGLALLCSGLAFIWYYRLMENVGPTKALTVAFLMPVFGMTWAALFLGEPITLGMAAGAGLILTGTYLVVKKTNSDRTPKNPISAEL